MKGKIQNRRYFLINSLRGILLFFPLKPFFSFPKSEASSQISTNSINDISLKNEFDWQAIKKQFTLDKKIHHFNIASIGSSPLVVQEKIISTIKKVNKFGKEKHEIVNETRNKLAKLVNANSTQLAITRNTTEGLNIVARSLKLKRGDQVIITSEEHVGGTTPWLTLQNEIGIRVVVIDILGKESNATKLIQSAITKRTKVVSVSHLTYTTGTILPIKEIINLCRKKRIYSVIDGAQALGHIKVDLGELQPDFYTASCCKWLYGPNGTGMLYLNKSFLHNFPPLFAGAYTDRQYDAKKGIYEYKTHASRYEYGTVNAPIIAGLGAAIDFVDFIGVHKISLRGKALALRFRKGIYFNKNIKIITTNNYKYSASIVTFKILHKDNAIIKRQLFSKNSFIIRLIFENNINALRASFCIYNDEIEVDQLIKEINLIANNF